MALLRAAGINASHELVYSAAHGGEWEGLDTDLDVSMLVGFYLPLPYPVGLQVRHPLKTIASWASTGMLNHMMAPFRPRLEEKIGPLAPTDSALDFSREGVDQYRPHILGVTQFWCRWNRYCESHADWWWRVEDLPERPHRQRASMTLDDVPEEVKDELMETAAHFGYEL